MKLKRTRILTNRDFEDGKSYELIEQDASGHYFWRAVDYSYEGVDLLPVECCFPVDVDFVKEKFLELGRLFNESSCLR